jgi:hypothetical protein
LRLAILSELNKLLITPNSKNNSSLGYA